MSVVRVEMEVDKINVAKFNPLQRIKNDKYMKRLVASINDNGFLPSFPLLYSDIDKCLGDGHRRLYACKLLGIKTVPVDVYEDMSAGEIWNVFNATRKNMNPNDVTVAYSNGLGKENIPEGQKYNIELALGYIGEEGLRFLSENYLSPTIVNRAVSLANYCEKLDEKGYVRQIVYWMVKHKQSNVVRRVMDWNVDPIIIINAIKRDIPVDMSKLKMIE